MIRPLSDGLIIGKQNGIKGIKVQHLDFQFPPVTDMFALQF